MVGYSGRIVFSTGAFGWLAGPSTVSPKNSGPIGLQLWPIAHSHVFGVAQTPSLKKTSAPDQRNGFSSAIYDEFVMPGIIWNLYGLDFLYELGRFSDLETRSFGSRCVWLLLLLAVLIFWNKPAISAFSHKPGAKGNLEASGAKR